MAMQGPEHTSAIDRWLSSLVPDDLEGDELRARSRALLLLRFTLLGAVLTTLLSPYFVFWLGRPLTGWLNLAYGGALALTPVVLWRTRSVVLAAHWALANAFLILLVEAWVLGGVSSGAYPWLGVLPVGGMLLAGRRAGTAWGVAAVTALVAIGAAQITGWIPNAPPTPVEATIEQMVAVASLTVALTCLASLSERQAQALLTFLERERRHYETRSLRDPLTGLANRALLNEHLLRSMERCRRQGQSGALLYLDLDGFKPVNDAFGHSAGDLALEQVGHRLSDHVRRSDLVARVGGDEFALVIEGVGTRADVERLLDAIADSVEAPIHVPGGSVHIGVSIGVASYPGEDPEIGAARETIDSLLKRADRAMYRAKRAGLRYAFDLLRP